MNNAFDHSLLTTLESMLAPGGRVRVSPYIESAQFEILFGARPEPSRRHETAKSLLKQHDERVTQIAQDWVTFTNEGKLFTESYYASKDHLDAYLAYYCTTNVAKVQLSLLDLLRAGALHKPRLQVLDVGVGTGTSMLGFMDFLFTWATVCALYGVTFPIEEVLFCGIDRSDGCLAYSRRTAEAFADVLRERGDLIQNRGENALIMALEQWTRASQWICHDINETPFTEVQPDLVIASNSFNELGERGQDYLGAMIRALPTGSVGIIIEPGAEKNTQRLMKWRRELVEEHPDLKILGPCGNSDSSPLSDSCSTCWTARRESLHQPLLYKRFRELASHSMRDGRPFHDFENNLLSWSYVLLQKEDRKNGDLSHRWTIDNQQIWPESQALTYMGAFRGKSESGRVISEIDTHLSDAVITPTTEWTQYLKFCPGSVDGAQTLTLRRNPGVQLPPLPYGTEISITGVTTKLTGKSAIKLETSSLTQITTRNLTSSIRDAFLPAYSQRVQVAIDEVAYRLFGFPQMHPFQHRILAQVLTGKSILGIAATGGGKSECYILPAMLLPGITVVVSPLKSLMADQYNQRICQRYGLDNLSTFINGDVLFGERQARLARIELGHYKLIFVTPEQLERSYVLDSLRRADQRIGIRYLALDEAHCISQWGHDFRSSYLNLVHRLRDRGLRPIRIALTATASPPVRQDLCEELDLNPAPLDQGGDVFIESSNRPELNLVVRVCRTTDEKVDAIVQDLKGLQETNNRNLDPGAAIVFLPWTGGRPDEGAPESGSQRGRRSAGVTRFASYLERALAERVTIYHGKMDGDDPATLAADDWGHHDDYVEDEVTTEDRAFGDMRGRTRGKEQQAFISSDRNVSDRNVMVATKGFGMGIDKPNIRLVLHRTPPANLEAYAQEAGRAGRDRAQADVILYYSPDESEDVGEFGTAKVPSDRQVQELFLSERYVRRDDVVVMRAFLRTVGRKVASRLYFTNDEVIDFFAQCKDAPQLGGLTQGYEWPAWPDRIPGSKESPDHAAILDRGHDYQQKSDYIKRILDVLYRIRPANDALVREAMILELRQCGASVINPRVYNADAIIESNAYFGPLLRQKGLLSTEFRKLYEAGDLISLANHLTMSLSELEQMIHDIQQSERIRDKYTGKWRSELLDGFITVPHYGPATNCRSLAAWRDYAGAWKRASKNVANARTKKPNRTQTDDWFGWHEVCSRRGWEVLTGPALERDKDFANYLTRFMELHDKRQANDWAAYRRLLTDYVGVEENGAITTAKNKQCLRAVLLGYLKTYEVIVGGNCHSCSRCVTDNNFAQFDLDQRQRVVVRMTEELEELLAQVEASSLSLPNAQMVRQVLDAVRHEQSTGRSLVAYLQGWTGRLLQDTPNHQAALVLRAEAMMDGVFTLQPHDLYALLVPIQDGICTAGWPQHLSHISRLLERGWTLLIEQTDLDMGIRFACHSSLSQIYEFGFKQAEKHQHHAAAAARHSPNAAQARHWYSVCVGAWVWDEVYAELQIIGEQIKSRYDWSLLAAWLDANPGHAQAIMSFLEADGAWERWSTSELEEIIDRFPSELWVNTPTLSYRLIECVERAPLLILLARTVVQSGVELNFSQIARVARAAAASLDASIRSAAFRVLSTTYRPQQWSEIDLWLECFWPELDAEVPEKYFSFWQRALALAPTDQTRAAALARLSPDRLLQSPKTATAAHAAWADVCNYLPVLAVRYVLICERVPEGRGHADHFLARLRSQSMSTAVYLAALRAEPPEPPYMALLFDRFAPEVAAESPSNKLLILQSWAPKFAQHTYREALLPVLWTLAQSLLDDEGINQRVRAIWSNVCVLSSQATRWYLEACLTPTPQLEQITLLLAQLSTHQESRAAAYAYLKQVLVVGDLRTLEFWLASFYAELTAEPIMVQIDMILGWVELLEEADLPVALLALGPVTHRLFVPGRGATDTHREYVESFGANLRRAALYLVLAELAPDGDDCAQLLLEQIPDQHLRSWAYAMTRALQKFQRWEPFAGWLKRHSAEISAESSVVQLELLEQGVMLRRSDLDRVSTRTTLRPLFSAAIRDSVIAPRAQELWRDVYLGDPDVVEEYLTHCDESGDEHLALAYIERSRISGSHMRVPLFRALRKRFKSVTWEEFARFITDFANEILTEPIASQFDLLQQGAALLPEGAARREAILVLEPLGRWLLWNAIGMAAAHQIWRNLCLEDSDALVRYLVSCEGLEDGSQYIVDLFMLLRHTNRDQAVDIALRRAQLPLPNGWEVLGPWLTRLAPEITAFPDAEALSLLHHAMRQLHKDKTLDDALPIVWPIVRALLSRVNTQVETHAVWRKACIRSRASLIVYIDYLNQVAAHEQLADELLKDLLNSRKVVLLAGMADRASPARLRMAALMVDKLLAFTGISSFNPNSGIMKEDCPTLARQFSYQHDPEQADMLVAALGQLRTWSTPTFLTPLSRQVEAAVHAGRFDLARTLAASTSALTVGKNRVSITEYIQQFEHTTRPRTSGIQPDYVVVAKQILGQGKYPTHPL